MKVRALRGVCIGIGRHLNAGDFADLDPATVTFLAGIGAVERVADPPASPVKAEPKPESKPEPKNESVPDNKTGKKEK